MKLTTREKIMLIVLGIITVLAASYYLMIKPQLEKIDLLIIEQEAVSQKVDEVKKEIASGGKLKMSFENEDKRIAEQSAWFYPEIFQPKLILVLDDLIADSGIKVSSLTFTPRDIGDVNYVEPNSHLIHPLEPSAESYRLMAGTATTKGAIDLLNQMTSKASTSGAAIQANPAIIEKMTVDIQYDATDYERVLAFIKGLEAQNRTLVIDHLNMEDDGGNVLKGNIAVTFYSLPKLHDQDTEYLDWPYNDLYGKSNPFK